MDGIDFHLARETVMVWSRFWIILGVGVVGNVAFWFFTAKVDEDQKSRITVTAILFLATVLFALLGSVSTTTTITWKG